MHFIYTNCRRGIRLGSAVVACVVTLAACSGASLTSFQPKFDQIEVGATKNDVMRIAGEPLSSDGWDAAGIGVSQLVYADPSATYTVVIAKVPFAEARVLGKKRVPHLGGRCS